MAGRLSGESPVRSKPVRFGKLVELFVSDGLVVRFVALFALAAAGFLICQTIAYLWLPQGLLRGASAGAVVTGDEAASSFMIEWARIIAWNLPVLILVFVAPNVLRLASGIPLGYLPAITMTAYMGIITGTNSFTMAAEIGKIAPSLEVARQSWLLRDRRVRARRGRYLRNREVAGGYGRRQRVDCEVPPGPWRMAQPSVVARSDGGRGRPAGSECMGGPTHP